MGEHRSRGTALVAALLGFGAGVFVGLWMPTTQEEQSLLRLEAILGGTAQCRNACETAGASFERYERSDDGAWKCTCGRAA